MAERLTAAQVAAINAASLRAWRRGQAADRQVAKPARKPRQRTPGATGGRKKSRSTPDYEEMLCQQLRLARITGWRRQYPFAPDRKYRADLFFLAQELLVEIDGGAHRIKARFKADIERDQVIFFLEIRKLRVSTSQVRSGEALTLIERALR